MAKESYSASLTPETIALPANSVGEVQDYANAKAKVKLTYDGKEIYPVYDERLDSEIGGRNLWRNSGGQYLHVNFVYASDRYKVNIIDLLGYKGFLFNESYSNVFRISQVAIKPDTKYTISFVAFLDSASTSVTDLKMILVNYGGGSYNWQFFNITTEPQRIKITFTSGAEAVHEITHIYSGISGVFMADFKLEEQDDSSPWTPHLSEIIGTLITQNCTAFIDANGEVSVSNLTADAGYVDIPISYGQFSTVKRLTLAKSKQGRSIVSSSYEYAQSTSATTTPTTGWVTTPPTWIDGRYIWVRTKITYSEGSPVTTDPINLTGAGGAVGTGINTITTEFYLSTSKTTQTGGSWSATRPAWVTGKYLWTRLKIVYKNPASTVYTTPVVSSEWEAVNNLRTELVLDYTSKLDVLEDQIEANVTETTSVKNSVTGLTTRVSQAEADLTIKAGQIASKVSKTDYDTDKNAINSQISLIQQQSNQIDVKVSRIKVGGVNLLRNYDMRLPNMRYWAGGAMLVNESGTPSTQLTVISVDQPSSITTPKNGSINPPSSIVLNISDGSTRTVSVAWDSYSTSEPGTFTIQGTYNLPSGVTGSKPTISFSLIVTEASLTVLSVIQPNSVSVPMGGTPSLPATVTLNISDGTTRSVPVTWGNYNTGISGTYNLSGSYNLPDGITGNKPSVSVTLIVADAIVVVSINQPNNVTIEEGDEFTPPSTVTLVLSTGTTVSVPVSWSYYDTSVGEYNIIGSYDLPNGVTGSKPSVGFTLIVTESTIVRTITSVEQPTAVEVDIYDNPILPITIILNISDGTTREVAVTWSNYSTDTGGTYTLSGEYNMPAGITGTKPSVSITLKVIAPLTIVGYTIRPANLYVEEGYSLDQWMSDYDFIDFVLSDGTTRYISVTWATDYNANSPADTYYINAVYTLPSDIVGDIYPVIVTMTVTEATSLDLKAHMISLGYTVGTDGSGKDYVLVNGQILLANAISSWLENREGEYSIFIWCRLLSGTKVYLHVGSTRYLIGYAEGKPAYVVRPEGAAPYDVKFVPEFPSGAMIYSLIVSKTSEPPSWYV